MGIRIRLHEGESIGQALRRFKKLVMAHRRGEGHKPVPWWYKSPHFVRNTDIRRYQEFRKRCKSRAATLAARREGKQPPPPE